MVTQCRYMMMMQCWELDPDKRPSFSSLVDSLSQSLEGMANYMDIGNSLSKSSLVEKHAVNSGKESPAANSADKPLDGKSEEILITELSLPPKVGMPVVNIDADETTL